MKITWYKVKKGDTTAKIAFYHGVGIEALMNENRNIPAYYSYLEPGTFLRIPTNIGYDLSEKDYGCLYEYGWRELETDRLKMHSMIHSEKIGASVAGKPIWLFRTGSGKKKIFFSAAWHGNEWLNTWLLMKFLKEWQKNRIQKKRWFGIDLEELCREITLYIVPLVNPDGAALVQEGIHGVQHSQEEILKINEGFKDFRHWSANASGVDLNHQWPAEWKEEAASSPEHPFPRHFGGYTPLSEPESKAIYELSMKEKFSHVIALHSQGEEIYWGYAHQEPAESKELANRLAKVSSYRAVQTADSKAGYKDWFIKEFKRPGFTVETGVGQNPLPMEASMRMWITCLPLLLESCTFPDFS
ncbi:LysM peptidoglycan-binding domain-containing protein [Salibacterium salarium]|uniref:LysM peptidoglycan-binding domain-containing protein n=1 Tax=Salibacterium salarium TaxID=284579 RepID=A0A3R9RC55_9BACI|nr:M14 family metallopeptidase [Salibacterium salarium]RSL32071.1 LysM peptidoglycan-binding domain-containing protein [Salibacterium salarium]